MSQTRHQKRFTISEVAADWRELMIPQQSVVPHQLDQRSAASRLTTALAFFRRAHRDGFGANILTMSELFDNVVQDLFSKIQWHEHCNSVLILY